MTSLARYEFVLVPGPAGVNRVVLVRTPKPAPRPNRDALPLHTVFTPEGTPPLPSWWLAQQAVVKEPEPVVEPKAGDAPSGWCPPDGPALKAMREGVGLPQRAAATVGRLQRGIVSDLERGKRWVGKGVSAACLYHYVSALSAQRVEASVAAEPPVEPSP